MLGERATDIHPVPEHDSQLHEPEKVRMVPVTSRLTMAILAVLALSVVAAPAAIAADSTEEPDETITWMVRPSDGTREDGRSWIELDLQPGETAQEHLLVRNLSRSPVTFTLTAADGYFTESGRFNMLTADEESTDAGTWVTIQDTVEVASGTQAIVPFTVTVPENATPGDHPAGVAASIRTGGEEVGIESRVGFRVMTRVDGELTPRTEIEITGAYAATWNPFNPGRLDLEYTITNTGNTRLSVTPEITATALFGIVTFTSPADEIVEFAPGESRTEQLSIPDAWPLVLYQTEVTAAATSVRAEPAAIAEEASATATAHVMAIPWAQSVAVVGIALLVWWLRADRRQRHRIPPANSQTITG